MNRPRSTMNHPLCLLSIMITTMANHHVPRLNTVEPSWGPCPGHDPCLGGSQSYLADDPHPSAAEELWLRSKRPVLQRWERKKWQRDGT